MSAKGCATCDYMRLDADEEPCVRCKHSGNSEATEDNYKPKSPPTNAERIRMMSDEELAKMLCPMEWDKEIIKCAGENCTECCLEWLRKESKNE